MGDSRQGGGSCWSRTLRDRVPYPRVADGKRLGSGKSNHLSKIRRAEDRKSACSCSCLAQEPELFPSAPCASREAPVRVPFVQRGWAVRVLPNLIPVLRFTQASPPRICALSQPKFILGPVFLGKADLFSFSSNSNQVCTPMRSSQRISELEMTVSLSSDIILPFYR